MNILVSGGAGFIGSHLCDSLISQGHEVLVLDCLSEGAANIAHLQKEPRFRLLEQDVTQTLPASLRAFRPHRIYNLACQSGPQARRLDPIQATLTSVMGARHLLELSRSSAARYLQASSGGIYGDPAVHPQPESYFGNVNPGGSRASHHEAKRCAETLCASYRAHRGVDSRVARIFNTYGPRMFANSGRVVSNFVIHALKGDDLLIDGDGTQSRSFCYVSDTVAGLIALMESNSISPTNLGNPEEITMLLLAERVLRLTGSQSRVRHVVARDDDAHSRRPDIELAEKSLAWRPKVPLRQGLQSTVEWFQQQTPGVPSTKPIAAKIRMSTG